MKYKKQIQKFTEGAIVMSASSVALGGIPGTENAQKGLQNASKFMPAMGTMIGVSGLMQSTKLLESNKKRKRK